MSQTPIEWTDYVWNPTRGCSRVSEGCRNCYAERIAARFSQGFGDSHKEQGPFAGYAIRTDSGPRWTGKVELIESKLLEPLHWKKPRRVFVNSMSDLFHENLPDESIDRVFAVMETTRHITYQVLTKRAQRMREYLSNWRRAGSLLKEQGRRPLDNVWIGVSVENQATADERIPELLRTPAAIRFVSYEPALEQVNFTPFLDPVSFSIGLGMRRGIGWGIIGGESGPGARPFDIEWARNTIRQFKAAGVPLFVKQLGARPVWNFPNVSNSEVAQLKDSKGGDWAEWPADLRVREFPCTK